MLDLLFLHFQLQGEVYRSSAEAKAAMDQMQIQIQRTAELETAWKISNQALKNEQVAVVNSLEQVKREQAARTEAEAALERSMAQCSRHVEEAKGEFHNSTILMYRF